MICQCLDNIQYAKNFYNVCYKFLSRLLFVHEIFFFDPLSHHLLAHEFGLTAHRFLCLKVPGLDCRNFTMKVDSIKSCARILPIYF